MNKIEVKPSAPDRVVPMPGKRRVYFPHDVWTEIAEAHEVSRLIDGGDLVRNAPAAPAETWRSGSADQKEG